MRKLILLIGATVSIYAGPAYKGELEFKQADGKIFNGHIKGDEWLSWVESGDGAIIKYNLKSKNYEYAKIDNVDGKEKLVPSSIKYNGNKFLTKGYGQIRKFKNENNMVKKEDILRIWQKNRRESSKIYRKNNLANH